MLDLFRRHKRIFGQKLSDLLNSYQLPSFPSTVINVLSILRDPESSLLEIAMQLEIDPGLHVKILRTVNSSAFGFSTKVLSIPHAVTLLGRSRLESLVLSVAIKDTLPSTYPELFDANQFWFAAARRACLARTLANYLHPATQSESFSGGLLQDIAVPVLMTVKKEEYCTIYEQWKNNVDSSLYVLERNAFGFDHAYVGARMMEEWDMPEYLVRMISEHHNYDKDSTIEPAVRLSSYIRDTNDKDGTEVIIESCQQEFALGSDVVVRMIQKTFEDAENFSQMLQ